MSDPTQINTGRRWFRISVRTLMALVLIIACALGWIVNRAHVQRNAVAAVRKAGGTAMYDFEQRRGAGTASGLPAWRRLIANAIGVDFVSSATFVQMPSSGSEADCKTILARLGDFEQAELVNLSGPSVGNEHLASLRNMTRLRTILLQGTRITDAGLAHLKGLASLRVLMVNYCEITDEGLLHLKSLTNLDSLALIDTRVTDAGLGHLRALPNLKTLSITGADVTDLGIPELKRLVGLSTLYLNGTEISAAGIEELKKALPNTMVAR